MSIRFHCKRCGQLLGIASRKAGSEVNCPKCGFPQEVPTEEAAAATLALSRAVAVPRGEPDPAELVVYDEYPVAVETAPNRSPVGRGDNGSSGSSAWSASGDAAPAEHVPLPEDMILFPRRTFYIHAVLFVLVAVGGFASGFFIGRGAGVEHRQLAEDEAAREQMLIEGRVFYDPGSGQPAPDEQAVALALPESPLPQQRLSIQGIRPQDPQPPEDHPTLRAIRQLGGDYGRVSAEGRFQLVVPAEGRYYVLVISAHADRPADVPIDEADQQQIERYFQLGEPLVASSQYRWKLERIDSGFSPIQIEFGPNWRP